MAPKFKNGAELQWKHTAHGVSYPRQGIVIAIVPPQFCPLAHLFTTYHYTLTPSGVIAPLGRFLSLDWYDKLGVIQCIESQFSVDAAAMLSALPRRTQSYVLLSPPPCNLPALPKLYWPRTGVLRPVSRPRINQAILKLASGFRW